MFAAEDEAKKAGLSGDMLRQWRNVKIVPLQKQFTEWMDAVEPTLGL